MFHGAFSLLCAWVESPYFYVFSVGHNHFMGHGWWPHVGYVHWSCIRSRRNLKLNEWNSTVGSTSWKSKLLQINIHQLYIPKLCSNRNFSHHKIGRSMHFLFFSFFDRPFYAFSLTCFQDNFVQPWTLLSNMERPPIFPNFLYSVNLNNSVFAWKEEKHVLLFSLNYVQITFPMRGNKSGNHSFATLWKGICCATEILPA